MAVSRTLRHLLHIRNLEEEQSRLLLETALGELRGLEHALEAAAARDREGRALVTASAHSGLVPDRLAGLEETRSARRRAAALEPRIESTKGRVMTLRQAFLLKRVERQQAETLIGESDAREAIAAGRRGQQSLDDWYGSRLYGEAAASDEQELKAHGLPEPGLARAQVPGGEVEFAAEELERKTARSGGGVPDSE